MCHIISKAYIFKMAKNVHLNLLGYNNDLFELDFKSKKYGFFHIKNNILCNKGFKLDNIKASNHIPCQHVQTGQEI